jgi:hypothetical protein
MRRIVTVLAVLLGTASMTSAQPASAGQPPEFPGPPGQALFDDPPLLMRGVELAADRFGIGAPPKPPGEGFFATSGRTVSGAGWLSGGGGYRRFVFSERAYVEGSAGLSMRLYKVAQAKFEWPRVGGRSLTLGSQALWHDLTQVEYFGTGPDTVEAMRSQYRISYVDIIGYTTMRPTEHLSINAKGGTLRGIDIGGGTGPFRQDLPETRAVFPDEPALSTDAAPRFRHAAVDVIADHRDQPGYPSRGGLYRAGWSGFWGPSDGILGFQRAEVEGTQFVPLGWLSVALHGWGVFTDTSEGRYVPFYMMPTLGGHALRGYHAYRFSDRNLLLTSIEPRIHVTPLIDAAVFFDAGNVAPTAGDLNLDHRNWGVGVRLHTATSTLARLDVARSHEGWRFIFSTTDALRLSRLTRPAPQVPFSP